MRFARPHNILEKHLKNSDLTWASVIHIKEWEEYWKEGKIPPELDIDFKHLLQWLQDGAGGEMSFLSKNLDVRKDPRKILNHVSSVVSLVIPYSEGHTTFRKKQKKNNPIKDCVLEKTARYARVSDYHRAIKKVVDTIMKAWSSEALAANIISTPVEWRVATDSLPFLDRAHARLAGLGFIGKNTMLIRPGLGSYFFIAHILTNAPFEAIADQDLKKPLAANAIAELNCGQCRKCLDACPTGAIKAPFYLDSNLCLSYLTIEHRKTIDEKFIPHLQSQFYGCDICQDVCPYNLKTSDLQTIKSFQIFHKPLLEITLHDVALMDQPKYEKWFGGSAMTRAKYSGLVRNALYSLHASSDAGLESILKQRVDDSDPLISDTVIQLINLRKRLNDHDQQ